MIKAYTIKNIYVCQLTGISLANVEFKSPDGQPQAYTTFPHSNIDSLKVYLKKEAREWFLNSLETYIRHKEKVYAGSSDQNIIASIQTCNNALGKFLNLSLESIQSSFLRGEKHFRAILPNPSNNSRSSSEANLNELVNFCKKQF